MSALVEKLKEAIAKASGYIQGTTGFTARQQEQNTANVNINMLVSKLRDMFNKLVNDPSGRYIMLMRLYLESIKRRYGDNVYMSVVNTFRYQISNTPYLGIFDGIVAGRDMYSILEALKRIKYEQTIEAIYQKYGKPIGMTKEEIAEIIDEKGRVRAEKIAEHIRGRLETIYGITRGGVVEDKMIKELIKDIRKYIKIGDVLLGQDVIPVLVKKIGRSKHLAGEPMELVKMLKTIASGDIESVKKKLLEKIGRKPSATKHAEAVRDIQKALREVKASENQSESAKIESERLKHMVESIKKPM